MRYEIRARRGFTLVEIMLSVAIGLVIMAGSVYGYRQVMTASKFSLSKSMVGTIQTNIGMDKFRLGSPPPLSVTSPSPYGISYNTDSVGKPYWPGNDVTGALPKEPVSGLNTVLYFNSAASPTPLVVGAPTPQWDNPVFATTGASPGYGNGGWLYDTATGTFRANLSNQAYPGQRPGAW